MKTITTFLKNKNEGLYNHQLGIEKLFTMKAEEKWDNAFPQQTMNWSLFYQINCLVCRLQPCEHML